MRTSGLKIGAWVVLGTLVFLAVAPVRASKPEAPEGGEKKSGHAKEKKKERAAIDEVSDQEHEWEIFPELGIHLPLVGWFELFGHPVPTKHQWLILFAAVLVAVIYIPMAQRMASGEPLSGPFWNAFESLLTFVRDQVAKPNLAGHEHAPHEAGQEGHGEHHGPPGSPASREHPADRFVPFLWTLFLFVLFGNLLGMFPFLGSFTANICVTGALALCCLVVFFAVPIYQHGLGNFLKSMWPKIDVGIPFLGGIIKTMIFGIEMFGIVIKAFVLAVRLFANMFAGHMVLGSILLFVYIARNDGWLWGVATGFSVLGVIALSFLELFVGFLQAYIFVFLAALFLGMTLNPEH